MSTFDDMSYFFSNRGVPQLSPLNPQPSTLNPKRARVCRQREAHGDLVASRVTAVPGPPLPLVTDRPLPTYLESSPAGQNLQRGP